MRPRAGLRPIDLPKGMRSYQLTDEARLEPLLGVRSSNRGGLAGARPSRCALPSAAARGSPLQSCGFPRPETQSGSPREVAAGAYRQNGPSLGRPPTDLSRPPRSRDDLRLIRRWARSPSEPRRCCSRHTSWSQRAAVMLRFTLKVRACGSAPEEWLPVLVSGIEPHAANLESA